VGWEVYLIAPDAKEEIINNVKLRGVPGGNGGRLSRMTITVWRVYQKALAIDADIYHFHDPELLIVGLLLKWKGKKVIYDVHEDVPRQILGKYWINKYLRKFVADLFELFESGVSSRIDYIITATPYIRDRFLKYNTNTIDICNYPMLGESPEPACWRYKKNEICYVGAITKMRGIVEIIKVLETTSVKLNLAGDYSPTDLRKELTNLKEWKNVKEYGFVGREKIYEIFDQSKIGIVTLHPQINYLDALPIKMFEYMLAGIPVIASDFPLWRRVVLNNNCGICVDPLNPEAIARAVNYLLAHEKEAEQMGKNGRKAVQEKYNWKMEEEKLIAVYNQMLV
jgi:glycosyltransferase involved in cell wall biosynthesis